MKEKEAATAVAEATPRCQNNIPGASVCERPITAEALAYPFSKNPRWIAVCAYHARMWDKTRPLRRAATEPAGSASKE